MIIGENRDKVIDNIKEAIKSGELNKKVEINDPSLTSFEQQKLIKSYLRKQKKLVYKMNSRLANKILSTVIDIENKETEIIGIENIENINSGAIITSNHFNPLDNTIIQKLVKEVGKNKLYIVGQTTNLAMTGFIGFMMNHANIIPLSKQVGYMKKDFPKMLEYVLNNNEYILIYPEEEMWFNYRKPRTLKPGAYYYAAKNNVPIISCFVEIINKEEKETEEFYKIKYRLHILKPIYPDINKTLKENSIEMMEKDYIQKKEAYEKAYNKELDYTFEQDDIAGWIQPN